MSKMTPGRYYSRRPSTGNSAYEEKDWKAAVDPDGNQRDRTREREQYLDDVRHELEFVNTLPPGRVLDIGCGLGFFLSGINDKWEKHGVEMSQFAVDYASQWGRVVLGPVEAVAFPPAYFDVVVLHHVIEHIEDPGRTMSEVRRILAPGGRFIVGTPDFDSACARRFGSRYRLLYDKTHISLFSNESMHRFLRAWGFLIEHVDYPFFDTRHFTEENLVRMLDATRTSPPFYGSFMTFYCTRPAGGKLTSVLQRLGSHAPHEVRRMDADAARAVAVLRLAGDRGGRILIDAGSDSGWLVASIQKPASGSASGGRCDRSGIERIEALGDSDGCSDDVVVSFRLKEGSAEAGGKHWQQCERILVHDEALPCENDGWSATLSIPLAYGVPIQIVELCVLSALVGEVSSENGPE